MTSRRSFLKKAGIAGVTGATALSAPAVHAQSVIKWRMQTYAGPALAAHVIKPAIDAFNQAANGQMEIELFFADQFGIDVTDMNNYGCSLIWGHPQGPMGLRSVIELIEELALRGGGYGLFSGCAAGDTAMAIVIQVVDRK
ncbi:MAG: twin-arginine translocation signal domain-containing protein [Emcibacter sp.]|nr:twin-arginine translocation signal domain-containing protein [Emcibacter sp.]